MFLFLRQAVLRGLVAAGLVSTLAASAAPASAQATPDELANQALAAPPPAEPDVAAAPILELLTKGGWLMAPIGLMSILVVAVAVERLLGLRRSRVMPRALARGLRQLAEVGDFEPRTAYRFCRDYPSATARVVTAMLAKAGRPHAEVEAAATEAIQQEADQMHANVRTLNLAAAVTPLMGLLGTVWGMIVAFNVTASLPPGSNKGPALAEGIYFALVTTFAGLAVAIPAAVLAHYFEGRILGVTRRIERLVKDLTPRLERLEGGPRVDLAQLDADDHGLRAVTDELIDAPDWSPPHGAHTNGGPANPHDPLSHNPLPHEGPTETWRG